LRLRCQRPAAASPGALPLSERVLGEGTLIKKNISVFISLSRILCASTCPALRSPCSAAISITPARPLIALHDKRHMRPALARLCVLRDVNRPLHPALQSTQNCCRGAAHTCHLRCAAACPAALRAYHRPSYALVLQMRRIPSSARTLPASCAAACRARRAHARARLVPCQRLLHVALEDT
jgi:hypothetical protein